MIKRYDRVHYMNTSANETPDWKLINDGIISFDDDLAPKTETKQYIADKAEHEVILSYKPSYKYTAEVDNTDPVNAKLFNIGADQLVGQTCEIITVDTWTLADGVCSARKATFNVIPSKAGSGEAGGFLKMEGTLAQVGEIVKGQWTVATAQFA